MNIVIYELNDFFEVSPKVQHFDTWGSQSGQIIRNDGLSVFLFLITL